MTNWHSYSLTGIVTKKLQLERTIMLKKIDDFLILKFPHIISAFALFWFSIVAYGLLNQ